jgi:predicted phosphoadenosine phosphosulfate sulfurtransferase
MKKYTDKSVLAASIERISEVFDSFEHIYVSFSGGKDSTVMLHLVMEEAIKRGRKVGVLIIDLEAQYTETIRHLEEIVNIYKNNIDLHWFCGELLLRNAVTNFEPRWACWDSEAKEIWVREKPALEADLSQYDFYVPKMEFEELMVIFGDWYGKGEPTACFVGIRADESLHRYCAIATWEKEGKMFNNRRWTTKVTDSTYNIYPIYDWKTQDIWVYHGKFPEKPHNKIYDKMNMAGVKLSQQRLCQPYGDDQRQGLWLYHILEPDTWSKLILRVNGVNSGALYIQESGNITGYNKITRPEHHTWKSYTNFLLSTMPKKTQKHYREKFVRFISGWKRRGYTAIPDEAPIELESKQWAPSWRRMAKTLLRNDYWCKGLGFAQPKSEAYEKFKEIKKSKKEQKATQLKTT